LIRELRAKLRDYPEVNYLYQSEETSDPDFARILYEALDDLNLIGPVFDVAWTFLDIPARAIRLVLDFAVCRTLIEVMIWMARNEFQYQSGNTSIKLFDRWRSYMQIQPMLKGQVEASARAFKVATNMNLGWGSNLTEMYDAWRSLESADWVTVSV
jgi:hypothetical protein